MAGTEGVVGGPTTVLKYATQLDFGDGLPTVPTAEATVALKPSPPVARRPVAAARTILFRICPSFQWSRCPPDFIRLYSERHLAVNLSPQLAPTLLVWAKRGDAAPHAPRFRSSFVCETDSAT